MNPDFFEVIMLICFGAAWPFSIYRMLKTKKSEGKSIIFILAILFGYIAGIFFEWFGERTAVIYLYMFNMGMIGTDLGLTLKYRTKRA